MNNRRLNMLLLLSFPLSGCTTGYADPSMRGALFDTDVLRIPAIYHSLWADRLDSCGVTRDYGAQVHIGETTFGAMQLRRVMTYSDDAAVQIDLVSDESDVAPTEVLFSNCQTMANLYAWTAVEKLLGSFFDAARNGNSSIAASPAENSNCGGVSTPMLGPRKNGPKYTSFPHLVISSLRR